MGIFSKRRAASGEPVEPPVPADMNFQPAQWAPEGREDLLLVGESYYPTTFMKLCGGDKTSNGERECVAYIVAEPENKYDRNAVAVWIDEGQVGYIPRDKAAAWQRVALALRASNKVMTVPCWVWWGPWLSRSGDQVWGGTARLRGSIKPPTLKELDVPNT